MSEDESIKKGSILLAQIKVIERYSVNNFENRPCGFQVGYFEYDQFYVLYVCATNNEECDTWIASIQGVLAAK